MELKDYLAIIARRIWYLIIPTLVIVIGVGFFTLTQPTAWDGSATINALKKTEQNEQNNYQYDQYYALNASTLFAETIKSWLSEPAMILTIYQDAGLDSSELSIKRLSKVLATTKAGATGIKIEIRTQNADETRALLQSTVKKVKERTEKWNQLEGADHFLIEANEPVVLIHQVSLVINLVLGLIAGLVLGLVMVFMVEYFKPQRKK